MTWSADWFGAARNRYAVPSGLMFYVM